MSRKIDNLLDTFEKRAGLSTDGRDWLIAAVDPFHDADISIAGYPDTNTAATVVQLVKKQITIASPTTLLVNPTDTWDCNISLFPCAGYDAYGHNNTFNTTATYQNTTLTQENPTGGLVVVAGRTGAETYPTGSSIIAPAFMAASSLNAGDFVKGNGRIIGMAFEVVNTTADIYRQGQCTVYRMPTQPAQMQFCSPTATVSSVILGRFPPSKVADAMLLYGSRSWAAAEGAYVVSRQNSTQNPLVQPTFTAAGYVSNDIAFNQGGSVFTYGGLDFPYTLANYRGPFDISGAFFTGLSSQTTLTVNVRWLIERMPGPSENDLVVLATPSSAYDPVALELYVRCLRDMPPGVMLKENPLGEWFRNVLSKVAKYAPTVGNALGAVIPGAGLLGESIGNVAGVAKKMIPQSANDKMRKKKRQEEREKQLMLADRAQPDVKPALKESKSNALVNDGRGGRAAR